MSMKKAVGKRVSKEVTFCDEKVTISKLSVADVFSIEQLSKDLAGTVSEAPASDSAKDPMGVVAEMDSESKAGLNLLKKVICISVQEANELEEGDWLTFPFDELQKLSSTIMAYSGMGGAGGK